MEDKKYFEEVKRIENEFYSISSKISLGFPKIINLEKEKKKFFQALADDLIYNPKFKFEIEKIDEQIIGKLNQIKINLKNDKYNLKKIYKEKINDKILTVNYHKYWGNKKSSYYSINSWGKPNLFLVYNAKKICKNYSKRKIKFKFLDYKFIGKELKKEVFRLTCENIKIAYLKTITTKVGIFPNLNLIQINKKEKFTSIDLKRLKIHEIGVHYLRYFNGKKIGFKIFEIGTSKYLETEEGLAVYTEKLKHVSSKAQMFIYAGRVIATHYCLKKSFYEVFQILKSYNFQDATAFAITTRSKRNLKDTSKKGGFTKDYVYFNGYLKIKKYVKNGGDIKELFFGKIKIEDLKTLKKFIELKKERIKT